MVRAGNKIVTQLPPNASSNIFLPPTELLSQEDPRSDAMSSHAMPACAHKVPMLRTPHAPEGAHHAPTMWCQGVSNVRRCANNVLTKCEQCASRSKPTKRMRAEERREGKRREEKRREEERSEANRDKKIER